MSEAIEAMKEATKLAESAPELNEKEKEQLNGLFPAYIFRRSRTRDAWTTCCRKHMKLNFTDAAELAIMTAEHQREPKNTAEPLPAPSRICPYCGARVIVKELGRTGGRMNLCAYRRALVLRWYEGALWGRAYDCSKTYPAERLTEGPNCHLVAVYRFRPGIVESTSRYYWNYPFTGVKRQTTGLKNQKWEIGNPFSANSEYGIGYDIIGVEEIQKSPFRYCMPDLAAKKFYKYVQFLTACCFYPRKIEMLMKAGMTSVVSDLISSGVKHAYVIKWDDESQSAFGLNKQQLKEFLATDRNIKTLELHKKLDGTVSITRCAQLIKRNLNIMQTASTAKKWNIPIQKAIAYLEGQTSMRGSAGPWNLSGAQTMWSDYLTAAEALSYPLHRENVRMPKNLGEAHNEATKKHNEMLLQAELDAKKEELRKQNEAYQKRKNELIKKYSFECDGICIRVPERKEEILVEGRVLEHCVAGYADRHISGEVTILFMRTETSPETPWLTIEMDGNRLRQIHGYKNEGLYTYKGRFAPDPRETYRGFLDTWLSWIKAGSKRNKDGTPKIKKKKEKIA